MVPNASAIPSTKDAVDAYWQAHAHTVTRRTDCFISSSKPPAVGRDSLIRQGIPSSSPNVRRLPVGRSGARIRASRVTGDECDFVKIVLHQLRRDAGQRAATPEHPWRD